MEKVKRYTGKILVVDDEKVNVDFFQVMLSRLGFEVATAYDGEEALGKVNVFNPDIILLDLIMPKLSGFELTNILKNDEKTKHIPIIILTAVDDIKEKVDMLELGIEDYITKPFNFIEILARIRSILRSKRLKDEILRNEQRLKSIRKLEEQVGSFIEEIRTISGDLVEHSKKKRNVREVMAKIGESLDRSVDGFESQYQSYISENKEILNNSYNIPATDDACND
ncbi:MAG: response regulator [Spirochaetota bacterium]|nr:MAG: response regulator [Spirochaetota bacterium]